MEPSEQARLLDEREGNDITASDMIVPAQDSDLLEFYKHSKIFITGGTGFLGNLCMEKLLRTCPDLDKIYILVRPKKGKDTQKRFEEMFDVPSYEPLKRKFPNFTSKIQLITGDVGLPELGISKDDQQILISEVNCIFHFAATVRFDEKLRLATNINVKGVKELIKIARQMKNLRSIVHTSTAYSNCLQKTIDEQFYEPPITGDKLISLLDCLDDKQLDEITPILLGKCPNTYTFTKCVAEGLIRDEGKTLPIAVYRPSIVVGTVKEPVAGYMDNVYGAMGVFLGVAMGLLRVLNCQKKNHADLVPADYVINGCLAVAWEVATMKALNNNKEIQDVQNQENEKFENNIPVYNYVSTPERPITWDMFHTLCEKHASQIPSEKVIWHADFRMVENKLLHSVLSFLLHTVPAYLVDFIAFCIGKKGILVKSYQKIDKFGKVLSFFCVNEWIFKNDNIKSLWQRLKPQDKELFEFSMKSLDWDSYFYTFTRGGRVYILKDPLDTIPKGRIKYWKLFIAHHVLRLVLLFLLFKLVMFMYGCLV